MVVVSWHFTSQNASLGSLGIMASSLHQRLSSSCWCTHVSIASQYRDVTEPFPEEEVNVRQRASNL
jgi:hypothetical protein